MENTEEIIFNEIVLKELEGQPSVLITNNTCYINPSQKFIEEINDERSGLRILYLDNISFRNIIITEHDYVPVCIDLALGKKIKLIIETSFEKKALESNDSIFNACENKIQEMFKGSPKLKSLKVIGGLYNKKERNFCIIFKAITYEGKKLFLKNHDCCMELTFFLNRIQPLEYLVKSKKLDKEDQKIISLYIKYLQQIK